MAVAALSFTLLLLFRVHFQRSFVILFENLLQNTFCHHHIIEFCFISYIMIVPVGVLALNTVLYAINAAVTAPNYYYSCYSSCLAVAIISHDCMHCMVIMMGFFRVG